VPGVGAVAGCGWALAGVVAVCGAALGAAVPGVGAVAGCGSAFGAAASVVAGPGRAPGAARVERAWDAVSAPLAPFASGAAPAAWVSGAVRGAGAPSSAVATGLARARDAAGLARLLPAVFLALFPDRAAGAGFDRVLAVAPDREVAAAVFGRAPVPDPVGRVPAGTPEAVEAAPVPSAPADQASGSVVTALPWSGPVEAALAARGRLAAPALLSAPAGCFLAARLGAGPVPLPGEPSPGVPFSEVTAP
jgi:hypothetical protein